jgi:hypothetical protein
MKKRTEAFKRVFALLRDAAHIEGGVAQTVLETNPLIGRPARRSRRELIIGRPTRGYIALYRYVSEIRHRIHPRLAQPARSGVQAGLIREPAAFVDNRESQRQFLKLADHARCVPLRATARGDRWNRM